MTDISIDAKALCSEIAWIRKHEDSRRAKATSIMEKLGCSTGKPIVDVLRLELLICKATLECLNPNSKAHSYTPPDLCSDAVLMSLGLLRGYEYDRMLIDDRQEAFLRRSDWLKRATRPKWKISYDDASDTKKEKAILSLERREWDYIEEVCKYILENTDALKEYLSNCFSTPEKHFKTIKNRSGKVVAYRIRTPLPNYVLKETFAKMSSKDVPPEDLLQLVYGEIKTSSDSLEDISDETKDSIDIPEMGSSIGEKSAYHQSESDRVIDTGQDVVLQQDDGPTQEEQTVFHKTDVDNRRQTRKSMNYSNYGFVNTGTFINVVMPSDNPSTSEPSIPEDPYLQSYYEMIQYWETENDLTGRDNHGEQTAGTYISWHLGSKIAVGALLVVAIIGAALAGIFEFPHIWELITHPDPAQEHSNPSQIMPVSVEPNSLEAQLPIADEDMPEVISEARSSIEVLTESGEYDLDAIKNLIFSRIVNNPVYGDMIVRGFWETDSFMQSKIAERHPQFIDFVSESSAALGENEPDTFIPDMSHWLIKISSQVSTTDNYKGYASFLCAVLENSFSEIRVDNFDSTSHWSIGGDAEGISVHAELVERSSNQPAIIFENIGDDNQLRYQVAFFLEDGSFATCNPWVQQSRSRDNPGKERPSYTIEEIENGALGDKIVFNSISDGPFGDEKNFVSARQEDDFTGYEDSDIAVENGNVYEVRLYAHNNNPKGEEATAENVRVAFALPELNAYAKDHQINGFITSSNASPGEYWDYINFHSDTCFKLTYIPGSAKISTRGFANGGTYDLNDSIVKTLDDPDGVFIGYEQFADGEVPGGFEYTPFIYILVKVEYPDFGLRQQVRLAGDNIWKYNVEANVGDKVEFQIGYRNIDDEGRAQENVLINDILPDGLRYIDGSTILYNQDHQQGLVVNDEGSDVDGLNIGSYTVNSDAYVRFTAEVIDDNLEPGQNTLVNWAKGTVGSNALTDYATVTVYK